MAKVDDNDVTLGLRGKFGKQFVFRKFLGRTIATRKAAPSVGVTDGQLAHREKFRLATIYAKRSLLQPELKADYEAMARAKNSVSAFAAAIGDYLTPMAIIGILNTSYQGEAGFPLSIMVNDLFKVKDMKVTFTDAGGAILESGFAVRSGESAGYTYVTTVAIPVLEGVTITVEATDRPGNTVVEEVKL